MLGGLALKRSWQHRRAGRRPVDGEAQPGDGRQRPGLLGEVRELLGRRDAPRADGGQPVHPERGGGGQARATRTRSAWSRSSARRSTARTSRSRRSARRSTTCRQRTGLDVPVHVDGASGAFIAPFVDPELRWDFQLPRVKSINASGHKYGLVYPGVGWIVWRDETALPEDLIFRVNYLGDDMPTFALNFSRPGAQVVAQYYNFLRLGLRRATGGCSRRPGRRHAAVGGVEELGPFELLTRGDPPPVFAFRVKEEIGNFTVFDVSPRFANAAGRSPPTRFRRSARIWRCCASSCARVQPRPGGPADRRPEARARAARGAARADLRRRGRGVQPLGVSLAPEQSGAGGGAYVAPPPGAQMVSTSGPGPFVTQARFRLADGRIVEWASRRHRKRAAGALGRAIAVNFIIGSLCFAVGSVPGYASLVGSKADAITYFVGSIFFTTAAYLQYVECISAGPSVVLDAPRKTRFVAIEGRRIDWWATTIQLAGTIAFNVTTFAALDTHLLPKGEDLVVWTPDAVGVDLLPRRERAGVRRGRACLVLLALEVDGVEDRRDQPARIDLLRHLGDRRLGAARDGRRARRGT